MLPVLFPALPVAVSRPTLRMERPELQATIGVAFEGALDNLLRTNTVGADPKVYNTTGLMRGTRFFRAGGGYAQPWTRDAAVNSWNAGSLLAPEVARDTLFAVTRPDGTRGPVVQRDDQWWDKVIWIVAARNHYRVTGDREFLRTAYGISERTIREMRAEHYSVKEGLFLGPSFFNDGIAGYPSPPAAPDDSGSSFVLDHPGTERLMALSTNALYVGAYRSLAEMARELKRHSREWDDAARTLRARIERRFWIPARSTYGYLLHPDGTLDTSQEGSGLAFSILFDVASAARGRELLARAHVEPYGVTDVWPHFPRFSDERPGRHNVIVWPVVQGFWARAAAKVRDEATFATELTKLARLSAKHEGRFFEIYNAKTGEVDGGWQNGHRWGSEPDRTWSATAYLSMITEGLAGMRFERQGLRFEPLVPKAWGGFDLEGVLYRAATLDIHLRRGGSGAPQMRVDGTRTRVVLPDLQGRHRIDLTIP